MTKSSVRFRLAAILAERGLKIQPFVRAHKLNYATTIRICHNQTRGITLDLIERLCTALDITPGDLFEIDPPVQKEQATDASPRPEV